jgi:hypothetical protein
MDDAKIDQIRLAVDTLMVKAERALEEAQKAERAARFAASCAADILIAAERIGSAVYD